MDRRFFKIFNIYVLIAGLFFSCVFSAIALGGFIFLQPDDRTKPAGTAIMQVISAPSDTPVLPTPLPSETPTPEPGTPPPPPPGVIAVGAVVQVQGTGTDGLRMRSDPGLSGKVQFVAIEAEVFRVLDGPVEMDGYTWWHLAAPYDEAVQGWSVSNYLNPIQSP
jgi:hypothetical protein